MSGLTYTVEQAAARLALHPKTVLRFLREGRLQGVKVGRAYRIPAAVLDAFAGGVLSQPAPHAAPVRVTGIVDIEAADDEAVRRLSALIGAAHLGGGAEPLRIDLAHDPARQSLKVVTVGAPGDVAALLKLIEIWQERRS